MYCKSHSRFRSSSCCNKFRKWWNVCLGYCRWTVSWKQKTSRIYTHFHPGNDHRPSSIYSWSIDHILEHEFFCLGRLGSQGSKEKNLDLRNSEQLLRVVFSTFCGQRKNLLNNILASTLKSYKKFWRTHHSKILKDGWDKIHSQFCF